MRQLIVIVTIGCAVTIAFLMVLVNLVNQEARSKPLQKIPRKSADTYFNERLLKPKEELKEKSFRPFCDQPTDPPLCRNS